MTMRLSIAQGQSDIEAIAVSFHLCNALGTEMWSIIACTLHIVSRSIICGYLPCRSDRIYKRHRIYAITTSHYVQIY